jgi:Replication-relaxation
METTLPRTELNGSERAILDMLHPSRYEELPTHYISSLVGRTYNPFFYTQLKSLVERRHLVDFKPNTKISKHHTYASVESGFSKNLRPHRLLQSMVRASIELGAKADAAFRLEDWSAIANATDKKGRFIVPRSTLQLIERNKSPHRIAVGEGHVLPDGRPFLLHHKDRHLYVLGFEIDRDTEPLTTTQTRRNIAEKFRNYKELFDKKLWKSHYGFDNSIVMFVATNESRMHAMMRLWDDTYGSCTYITFTHEPDWFYEERFPKKDLGSMFARPHLRVGHPPFYLDKFWDC